MFLYLFTFSFEAKVAHIILFRKFAELIISMIIIDNANGTNTS